MTCVLTNDLSPVDALNPAEQQYFDELECELSLLAQLPLVTVVNLFDKGDEATGRRRACSAQTRQA